MMVGRNGNTTSELEDLDVWTIRITYSAKLLKLHKETKKQHQLKSTENCFPLGQGARISGWPGPVRPLSFYSELTQILPETWIVMRATLWGSKPPAHCEIANTTVSEQKRAAGPLPPLLEGTAYPQKVHISRRKKSGVARGTVSTLSLCGGSLHLPFPPPFLLWVFLEHLLRARHNSRYWRRSLGQYTGRLYIPRVSKQTTKDIKHLTGQELNDTMEPATRKLGKLHLRPRETTSEEVPTWR